MTKKYTKDMTVEEVIERLQKGEVIKDEDDSGLEIKMINGIIVLKNDGDLIVGAKIITVIDGFYFEDIEPFQITKTGLYKTKNGRKAFVSDIGSEITGVIDGIQGIITWDINGKCTDCYDLSKNFDLVSKWEE